MARNAPRKPHRQRITLAELFGVLSGAVTAEAQGSVGLASRVNGSTARRTNAFRLVRIRAFASRNLKADG